jgi:glyoxylase-like metal-dependent hydrolase (beta-lactamase superfamily II)
MKLTAFQYGKTDLAESMIFEGASPEVKQPISLLFFLIEAGEKKILVDVGCDTMPGFELYEFIPPVTLLEKYISREEITHVVLTHCHHDHVDAVRYYTNAKVYINSKEYEYAKGYLEGLDVVMFDEDFELADGIEVKVVGGHFFGSCIVVIGNTVLCGDECYSIKNLEEGIMTGSTVCRENSRKFLDKYSKGYNTVLFHAPDVVGEIGYKTLLETDL